MVTEGFVQENETVLAEDGDFAHGKVYGVFRREGTKAFESNLYVRRYLAEFEQMVTTKFWKNNKKFTLYIKGPPGCGKTCFFYLWARLLSVKENARVLIIQYQRTATCFVWIREPGGTLWRWKRPIARANLCTTVEDILEKSGQRFNLCIHDGVVIGDDISLNLTGMLNTELFEGKIVKAVHVTSFSFNLTTGGQRLDDEGDIVEGTVDSWILEDYIDAIKCSAFVERLATSKSPVLDADKRLFVNDYLDGYSDDEEQGMEAENTNLEGDRPRSMKELVTAKHYYAGGSARFMFEFSLEELKTLLDCRCQEVFKDQWEYFAQGCVASSTPWAVNTLMQQFERKAMPVSKYILFKAYERCKSKLVGSMGALGKESRIPAINGWAFALAQIDLIRLSLESCSEFVSNDQGLSFRPIEQVSFDETKFEDDANVSQAGTVIWCQKWNQDCFDVAFLFNSTLLTLQFTVSPSHSLKPVYIRRLRDALLKKDSSLELDTVVHVGVTPTGTLEFEVGSEGTGRQRDATDSEFTIHSHASPPLKTKSDRFKGNQFVPTMTALKEIPMWKLTTKRKRSALKECDGL